MKKIYEKPKVLAVDPTENCGPLANPNFPSTIEAPITNAKERRSIEESIWGDEEEE